ncbi:hypothetical protein [Marinitoga sp. 1155]|uniref:hypothetical protein n=1 Tax=Marinitoga sp. 1155 TaxID=1428448 RepID=UPI0006414579|nr:hypothetical protein [Marinitoga sp. 1155]KLO24270.1 hypothetical protein X274_04230 [Marinitoga sp. 1155]
MIFPLLNENIELKLIGNMKSPQIKNFITWLGKFIKNIFPKNYNLSKKYNITPDNKKNINSANNFIKTFIKEIAKSIIENKSLKIPNPNDSAKIINKMIENTILINKEKEPTDILKNITNQNNDQIVKNKKNENFIKFEKKDVNFLNINENNKKNEKSNKIPHKSKTDEKTYYIKTQKNEIFHKALNAYKNFSQFESIQEPNFVFFQLFGMPIFFNISDEIDYEKQQQKKIKRIAFSFISNKFGLINSIIYKKDNSITINFNIERNIDDFKNNINHLINEIEKDGIKINALQINTLENTEKLNKKGLYG